MSDAQPIYIEGKLAAEYIPVNTDFCVFVVLKPHPPIGNASYSGLVHDVVAQLREFEKNPNMRCFILTDDAPELWKKPDGIFIFEEVTPYNGLARFTETLCPSTIAAAFGLQRQHVVDITTAKLAPDELVLLG